MLAEVRSALKRLTDSRTTVTTPPLVGDVGHVEALQRGRWLHTDLQMEEQELSPTRPPKITEGEEQGDEPSLAEVWLSTDAATNAVSALEAYCAASKGYYYGASACLRSATGFGHQIEIAALMFPTVTHLKPIHSKDP